MNSKKTEIPLTIGALIFVVVSLSLNAYILFHQSLRLDEAQSLWAATKSVPGIINYIAQDVHVPLYEVLLHFWIQIFGNSVITARTLSFMFFILTIPVLYLLALQSSDKKIALLSIVLFSLSPFIMWYSSEARMYSLLTFIACINHIYFLRLLRSNGKKGIVGYFFSTLFGLYTHYFFMFLIATQSIFLMLQFFLEYHQEFLFQNGFVHFLKSKVEILYAYGIALACAFLLFVPWVVYFQSQGLAANTQPLIPPPTTFNLFQTMANFLFGFQTQYIQSILVSLWPLVLVPIFFLFTKRRQIQLKNLLYYVCVSFVPIILVYSVSIIKPIYLSRYLIFVTPTLFIVLSWGIINFSKQAAGVLITTFSLTMFGFLLFQNISNTTPVKENYRQVTTYLTQHASSQDIIAVSAPFTIYPIEYYYTGPASIETIPEWNVYSSGAIPPFSSKNLSQQIKNYTHDYNNVYIVLSYDQGYQKDIVQYLDTHYQRKKLITFSPGLELREYKLRYK
jgi:uncharacterized membrane protein